VAPRCRPDDGCGHSARGVVVGASAGAGARRQRRAMETPVGPLAAGEQDREQSCANDVVFYHLHERGDPYAGTRASKADKARVNSKADK